MTQLQLDILHAAKAASRLLALTAAEQRSRALVCMAARLRAEAQEILAANRTDIALAEEKGLARKRINILSITEKDIDEMAAFFEQASAYADPVGRLLLEETRPDGLRREQRLVPLGVVAMVYEARPSVITDSAALCMRTGNALLLRGSRNLEHTDRVMTAVLRRALAEAGLPEDAIVLIQGGGHELTYQLAAQDRTIDLMILRGGYSCLEDIKRSATVPVIGAGPGNCHVFIDASAKADMALAIVKNSKVPRPLACNAAETILVHRGWAERHLAALLDMLKANGITIHGCPEVCAADPAALPATEQDWMEEYFAPDIAVRLVSDIEEAIGHINRCRTPHTECIVTEDAENAERFMAWVEANVVCHNASTRLTDGLGFGLGGEMGISTQKYPVGGPIGPLHLMQQKYYLKGNGTLR